MLSLRGCSCLASATPSPMQLCWYLCSSLRILCCICAYCYCCHGTIFQLRSNLSHFFLPIRMSSSFFLVSASLLQVLSLLFWLFLLRLLRCAVLLFNFQKSCSCEVFYCRTAPSDKAWSGVAKNIWQGFSEATSARILFPHFYFVLRSPHFSNFFAFPTYKYTQTLQYKDFSFV